MRIDSRLTVPALALLLGACGANAFTDLGTSNDLSGSQDAGATGDLARGGSNDMTLILFKLQSGMYKVGSLTMVTDDCMVNPNDPANPTVGHSFTLTNDGAGNIALGASVGSPPEASNGASCPGSPANPACASVTNPPSFTNNQGLLIRDNDIDDGHGCTEHRHIENFLTLTADNSFTAQYKRVDTNHMGCAVKADCTTTWTWDFAKE